MPRLMRLLRLYLPRFALVVVAVPLCFWGGAVAAASRTAAPEAPAALASAVCFAAVVLAPSTKNALVRGPLCVAVVWAAAFVLTR